MTNYIPESEERIINGVIYKATNTANGKVYIGLTTQGIEARKKNHLYDAVNESYGSYFHNAIRKYGESSFIWEEIDSSDNIGDLNKKEVYWIDYYNSYGVDGYNLTEGGEGVKGLVRSEGFKEGKSELFKEMWKNGHANTVLRGSASPNSTIIESEAIEIKELILREISIDCIASIYGIKTGVVKSIKLGVSWKHVISDEDIEEMSLIRSKINKIKAVEIKDMILEGKTLISISEIYDVDSSTISAIKRGLLWKGVITDEDLKKMNEVMPIKNKRVLIEKEALEIKYLLLEGDLKNKEIADIYGIAPKRIADMKRGKRWVYLFTKEELKILNPTKTKKQKLKTPKPVISKASSDLSEIEILEIKKLLIEKQYSQNKIAEMYGLFPMIISRIKNGQLFPDVN